MAVGKESLLRASGVNAKAQEQKEAKTEVKTEVKATEKPTVKTETKPTVKKTATVRKPKKESAKPEIKSSVITPEKGHEIISSIKCDLPVHLL